MSKYIDTDELKRNFIISEGKGYITDKFKLQLIQIIESIWRKLNHSMISELDSKVLCWATLRDVCRNWSYCNSTKYDNVLPYFTELTKRAIAKNYNKNISDLRREYYHEQIVKQRKEKLQKLYAER